MKGDTTMRFPRWYDRNGKEIEEWDAVEKFLDISYRQIDSTELPDGKWISTIWLGLDYGIEAPPKIFETMAFTSCKGDRRPIECERYSTENDAIVGHQQMVEKYSKEVA
jgi:hypothetical protein